LWKREVAAAAADQVGYAFRTNCQEPGGDQTDRLIHDHMQVDFRQTEQVDGVGQWFGLEHNRGGVVVL
jgi:hypothetical protein